MRRGNWLKVTRELQLPHSSSPDPLPQPGFSSPKDRTEKEEPWAGGKGRVLGSSKALIHLVGREGHCLPGAQELWAPLRSSCNRRTRTYLPELASTHCSELTSLPLPPIHSAPATGSLFRPQSLCTHCDLLQNPDPHMTDSVLLFLKYHLF